jgi:predicted ribosome quality control (RQC) complex YloA/Tae2 family protein
MVMLSLTELRRAATTLEAQISGHRIQAIGQPDATSVVLTTYGGSEMGRCHFRLSCRPRCARISRLEAPPRSLPRPLAFVQYLRSHTSGARVGGVRLIADDRQLAIRLRSDGGDFDLLLAIFGARSNVYLLSADGSIAASLRPLSETRPELQIGDLWRSPESRPAGRDEDRFAAVPDDRFLFAIEALYAELEQAGEVDDLRLRIERALKKEAKSLDRKLAKLEEGLEEARTASGLEREGELLKSVLSQVKRGDSEVVATDFETGETVAIALDPKLAPAENLERLFKRYRKAVRSLAKAGSRHADVEASREALQESIDRFRSLVESSDVSEEALGAFAEEPAIRKLVDKYAPRVPVQRSASSAPTERKLGKHSVPNRLMPRRYRTAGALEIWVGRSAAGNDHLSVRLARGRDLFFHLDGAPGSHVILRTEGRSDPPSEAVLDACELAVHFSKFKNASRADVHAVPIANVRKPKGSKPGLVTVHGGKTIHLRRTEARLQRILAARIED